jgi:hypothetical protein
VIRRWPYLIDFAIPALAPFSLRFDSSKFLKAVNYKHFSIGLTKFKRHKIARRKRNSSWLIYTTIFKFWIKDYNFFKKITKSQFYESIFFSTVAIYNFNYIKKKNILNDANNFNFLIYSFPKCFFFYFSKKYFSENVLFFLKSFNNTNLILASFLNETPQFNEKILPFAIKSQNNFYDLEHVNLQKPTPLLFLNNAMFFKISNIYKTFIFFFITR